MFCRRMTCAVTIIRAVPTVTEKPPYCGENDAMKFATYNDGSRDGQLMLVSRDLSQAHFVSHLVNRLQSVLDDWNYLAPQMQDLSEALNNGRARHPFPFDPQRCMAPLPRAYQWAPGFTDANLSTATASSTDLTQGPGDSFVGARTPLQCPDASWEIDFAAQLAVVTGDVPLGVSPQRGLDGVRLLMLANAWHWRLPDAGVQRAVTAFSPVAVTTDELAEAWSGGNVRLPLVCKRNGRALRVADGGALAKGVKAQHFGQLIASLARGRALSAGCVVGSNAIGIENTSDSMASKGFMQIGDSVIIDLKDAGGRSVFGSIEQTIEPLSS